MNEYNEETARNESFMRAALRQAVKAEAIGETPIGAVIVQDGKIIARAYNQREKRKNSLCHAEILAIEKACKRLGGWRLPRCSIYVTLEPCPMCAGAIIQSRIEKLYFGAYDEKTGCAGSVTNLFEKGLFCHDVEVTGGVLEIESRGILQDFFRRLRWEKKEERKKYQYEIHR